MPTSADAVPASPSDEAPGHADPVAGSPSAEASGRADPVAGSPSAEASGRADPGTDPVDAAPPAPPPPPRIVEVGEARWQAVVTGATRSGSGTDAGAPILVVEFRRVGLPEGGEGPPERRALAVGSSLDDLGDEELDDLFGRSKPIPAKPDPAPPAPRGGDSRGDPSGDPVSF